MRGQEYEIKAADEVRRPTSPEMAGYAWPRRAPRALMSSPCRGSVSGRRRPPRMPRAALRSPAVRRRAPPSAMARVPAGPGWRSTVPPECQASRPPETTPSILVRRSGETARTQAVIANEVAVQDSATPISPPETISASAPLRRRQDDEADDIDRCAGHHRDAKAESNRSEMAPTSACESPQTMFWIARASVKSAAVTPRSWVIGPRNSPKLCRIPMPRVSSKSGPNQESAEPDVGSVALWRTFPACLTVQAQGMSDAEIGSIARFA